MGVHAVEPLKRNQEIERASQRGWATFANRLGWCPVAKTGFDLYVRRLVAVVLVAMASMGVMPACAGSRGNPSVPPWPGYQIIMWQTKTARQYVALRAIGVTAARVQADRHGETPASARQKALPILDAGMRIYVENIATDFYSAYHRWFPDKPKNWKFLALKARLERDPSNHSVFIRHPSLSDPVAIARITRRITNIVRVYTPYRPLFFSLGDETGIADLTAAWDFDFSAPSLGAMRFWLRGRYGTLAALNREWGTDFPGWGNVIPSTTTLAMRRHDGNYASWSDFKAWMDVAFARSIMDGTRAVHAGAPWALSAIEGAQIPGWGGYNYSRLARSVDVMEMYDTGQNQAIARSFNPHLVILMTSSWSAPDSLHRAWQEFLRGTRGMVLWDPDNQLVRSDGSIGARGRVAAAFFREVNGRLGRWLMSATPLSDRIAVLYSPASFRIQWMLDHRAMGLSWTRRSAAAEDGDDAVRAARRRVVHDLSQLGFTPRFVDDRGVARGLLRSGGYRMLILPQSIALPRRAAAAIETFAAAGGAVLAEGSVGQYDGHGRKLDRPSLEELFTSGDTHALALPLGVPHMIQHLRSFAVASGLRAQLKIENPASGLAPEVKQYLFQHGDLLVAALLAEPGSTGTPASLEVKLALRYPGYAYDVRTGAFLGRGTRLKATVGSQEPTVIAFSRTLLDNARCAAAFDLRSCSTAAHLPRPRL